MCNKANGNQNSCNEHFLIKKLLNCLSDTCLACLFAGGISATQKRVILRVIWKTFFPFSKNNDKNFPAMSKLVPHLLLDALKYQFPCNNVDLLIISCSCNGRLQLDYLLAVPSGPRKPFTTRKNAVQTAGCLWGKCLKVNLSDGKVMQQLVCCMSLHVALIFGVCGEPWLC